MSKIRCISDGATTAQIKANRQNSQKSTGPRSAEGKTAVSKNAVKHGLFANETVIKGESMEEFEVFHDEMLAELAPVGLVESMLAERYVSLSWRLKRVERMQNQAIDVMIERDEQPSSLNKLVQSLLPKDFRQSQADASASNGEHALGRAAIKDYSNSRVLDRLMMYERRIENSMFKTMNELERLRLLRELEQANEAEEQFEPEPCPPAEKEVDSLDDSTVLTAGFARDRFKKQSQSRTNFESEQIHRMARPKFPVPVKTDIADRKLVRDRFRGGSLKANMCKSIK